MSLKVADELVEQETLTWDWMECFRRAVPWLAVVGGAAVLAHVTNLQTVATKFAAAPTHETLPPQGLWMIATAAASAGLAASLPQSLLYRALVAMASVILFGLLAMASPGFLALAFVVPVAAAALVGWEWWKKDLPVRSDLIAGALLVLIVSYAAAERYDLLLRALPTPMDPDAGAYTIIAKQPWGWATEFREPFFIWVLKAFHLFGGTYDPAFLRLVGVASSLISIAIIFAICWRWIGWTAAVTAAVLYASRPFMIYTSIRGLREDVIIAVTFLFLAACLHVWGRKPTLWSYIGLGVAGAAAMLLRMSSVNFVLVVMTGTIGYALWKHRAPLRRSAYALVPYAICVALLLPFLFHLKAKYGHPFFTLVQDVRFYANVELAGKHPDMPTREEYEANAYAGPPISASEYLFNYHTIPQLVTGTLEGLRRLYFGDFLQSAYAKGSGDPVPKPLYVLHLAGLAAMLLSGRRFLFATLFWFHVPILYFTSFSWFDPRLLTVAFAGYYVGIGAAATTAVGLARKLMSSGEEEPTAGDDWKEEKQRTSARRKRRVKAA